MRGTRSIRSTHRGRAYAAGALASLLLAPWPGPPGTVAAQWRPLPVGAVAPRVASPAADAMLVPVARPAGLTWTGARRRTAPNAAAVARRRHRDPFLAGVLGAVVPGLGHAYAGEPWRGVAIFLVAEGGMITALKADDHTVGGIGATIGFGAYLFSIMEAPVAATRFNERHDRPPTRPVTTGSW